MTNRQLDLTKQMVGITVDERIAKDAPLYKVTYIDGTWAKFQVLVVDESPKMEPAMTPEEFIHSSASSGRVELDDSSMTESRRMNCKDCP